MSNFSFSHSVFERLVSQGRQKVSLCGNGLTADKISAFSILKVFADDQISMTEKYKFVSVRIENIVGKGGHAGYQHALLFPQRFLFGFCDKGLEIKSVWTSMTSVSHSVVFWDWMVNS